MIKLDNYIMYLIINNYFMFFIVTVEKYSAPRNYNAYLTELYVVQLDESVYLFYYLHY